MQEDPTQTVVHPHLPMAHVCSVINRRPGETVQAFKKRVCEEMDVVARYTAGGLRADLQGRRFIARCALSPEGLTNSSMWGSMWPELPADRCVIALIPPSITGSFGYDAKALAEAPCDGTPEDVLNFMARYWPCLKEVESTDVPGILIGVESSGRLALTANAAGVQWLKENRGDRTELDVLADLLESHACNGGYTVFDAGDANPFVGLTSAPCIAESLDVADDGQRSIHGRFWYFGDYATKDMIDELIETGRLTLTLGPDQTQEEVPAPERQQG